MIAGGRLVFLCPETMQREQASDPALLAHYEGLVRKTASMYAGIVEDDYEDICQVLRIKVWRALLAFDPAKARQSRDAYVFMCLRNRVKDLVKKVRRNELFIEDVAPVPADGSREQSNLRDRFERRYFAVEDDQVFGDLDTPLIPSTLTAAERRVVAYLYADFSQAEIAEEMEIGTKEVATLVGGIREKMADWHPSPEVADNRQPVAA